MVAKGEGGWNDWEFKTADLNYHIGWISKVLLYSTGKYIQYPVINHNRKNMKKNICVCITESLCCAAEITL